MIRLLYDTTIGGVRFGQGALIELDATLEDGLIAEGDATRAINFSSAGLLPQRIAQSFAPVTRSSNNSTDTGWVVLASIVVPGGTMGVNSKLVIIVDWDVTEYRQAPRRWQWTGAAATCRARPIQLQQVSRGS